MFDAHFVAAILLYVFFCKSIVDPNPAVGVASLILVRFLCYYALDY